MKKELINKIEETLLKEDYCFVSFVGDYYIFHKDYCKYDLMSISLDIRTKEIVVEGVGYNSFSLSYFKVEELSTRTLKMILDKIETKILLDNAIYS